MHELNLISGNRSLSPGSLIPWLLLKQHAIAFHEIRIDLSRDDAVERVGWFSPSLKVPVLIHHDIKVWDALPICEYLAETWLEGRGWPQQQKKRAAARSVCAELHADFQSLKQNWPGAAAPGTCAPDTAAMERDIARLDAIMSCCRRKYGDGGDWLFGRFGIVDAFLAPFVICLDEQGVELTAAAADYGQQLLRNPWVLEWLFEASIERHEVRYAKAS